MEIGLDVFYSERSYQMALYMSFDSIEDFNKCDENPIHDKGYIHDVISAAVAADYNIAE